MSRLFANVIYRIKNPRTGKFEGYACGYAYLKELINAKITDEIYIYDEPESKSSSCRRRSVPMNYVRFVNYREEFIKVVNTFGTLEAYIRRTQLENLEYEDEYIETYDGVQTEDDKKDNECHYELSRSRSRVKYLLINGEIPASKLLHNRVGLDNVDYMFKVLNKAGLITSDCVTNSSAANKNMRQYNPSEIEIPDDSVIDKSGSELEDSMDNNYSPTFVQSHSFMEGSDTLEGSYAKIEPHKRMLYINRCDSLYRRVYIDKDELLKAISESDSYLADVNGYTTKTSIAPEYKIKIRTNDSKTKISEIIGISKLLDGNKSDEEKTKFVPVTVRNSYDDPQEFPSVIGRSGIITHGHVLKSELDMIFGNDDYTDDDINNSIVKVYKSESINSRYFEKPLKDISILGNYRVSELEDVISTREDKEE